jgi:hypothetical protein
MTNLPSLFAVISEMMRKIFSLNMDNILGLDFEEHQASTSGLVPNFNRRTQENFITIAIITVFLLCLYDQEMGARCSVVG